MMLKGRAWKFGDDINTDIIIATKHKFKTLDMNEIAKHAMEAISPNFSQQIQKGDIIVAGKNFGCGSSREHAPLALKFAGVGAVVAQSFARIFYRNAFNTGLAALECEDLYDSTDQGDLVQVDMETGVVRNITKNKEYRIKPVPPFLLKILNDGGLVEHFKKCGTFQI
jgi:3-isopropylmalate/(R)-2-methylmalate dehydratase small subunit